MCSWDRLPQVTVCQGGGGNIRTAFLQPIFSRCLCSGLPEAKVTGSSGQHVALPSREPCGQGMGGQPGEAACGRASPPNAPQT